MARRMAPNGFFANSRQNEVLTALINKHLQAAGDENLMNFANGSDFSLTTTERGIHRYVHEHLIAALDTLNTYQRNRRAQSSRLAIGPSMNRQYRNDPRTRLIELLKRWLRQHAANDHLEEDDVRRVERLCRDLLNHGDIFPARNTRSFVHTITDVYGHLQWQLREVLGQDRSCADLVDRALVLSKNLLSDAISFLLMGPTDLKQTDTLPSTEAVALWGALPADIQLVLPTRADVGLQKGTQSTWQTNCGSIIAALLSTPEAIRLFGGRSGGEARGVAIGGTKAIANAPADGLGDLVNKCIAKATEDFAAKKFKTSGLAGPFRKVERYAAREAYMEAARAVYDLSFLLGGAFTQFRTVGDGMGDYGMIRMAPWLHPFLKVLEQKVMRLKQSLEELNAEVEDALVLAKSRGTRVEAPVPTNRMCSRAHEAIDRAVIGQENHAKALMTVLEQLRARSAPERLPKVIDSLNDACVQLQAALTSSQFRLHVGDSNFAEFPSLENHAEVITANLMESDVVLTQNRALPADEPRCTELSDDEDGQVDHFAGKEENETSVASTPVKDSKIQVSCEYAETPEKHTQLAKISADAPDGPEKRRYSLGLGRMMREMSPIRVLGTGAGLGALSLSALVSGQPRPNTGARSSSASSCASSAVGGSVASELEVPGEPRGLSGSSSGSDGAKRADAGRPPLFEASLEVEGLQSCEEVTGDGNPFTPLDAQEAGRGAGNPFTASEAQDVLTEASPTQAADLTSDCQIRDARNPFAFDDAGDAGRCGGGNASPKAKVIAPSLPVPEAGFDLDEAPKPGARERAPSNTGSMRAVVFRCTSATSGLRRHDRRQIWIAEGRLHICHKGSMTAVKSIVDLCREVDESQLVHGNVITLFMRRPAGQTSEVKIYFFEFMDDEIAARFQGEIVRSRGQ